MKHNKQSYSRSFIIRYTLITAAVLAVVPVVCALTLHITFSTVQNTLSSAAQEYCVEKAHHLRLEMEKAATPDEILLPRDDIRSCTLFTRADDERRLLLHKTILGEKSVRPDAEYTADTGDRIIQRAFFETAVDPDMYTDGSAYWYTIYFPANIGDTRYIVQTEILTTEVLFQIHRYARTISLVIRALMIISLLSFIFLFLLSLHFFHGIQRFFSRLTRHAHGIASGLHTGTVTETDEDFKPLTHSFNILVEELKDREKRISELEVQNNPDTLFKQGVSFLKKKQYEEAEHIFSTLTCLNPPGYGSYFNLGVIYAKQNRYEQSLSMFQQALDRNPDDALTRAYCEKIKRHIDETDLHEKIS